MSWIARWKCHDTDRLLALEIFLQYHLYAVVFAHGSCRIYWNRRIDDMKEIPHLICGKTAVGGNYNLTRDSIAVKIKKSVGALKHRRTFALLFCQSKNQTITESDAPRGSQHQQAPEL